MKGCQSGVGVTRGRWIGMKIEVMYFQGCPNHHTTVEHVMKALSAERITCPVQEIEVRDDRAAQALGFLGSPSVRVNGLDVEPAARIGQRAGFGCRTYVDDGRRSGIPSIEMIRKALVEASGSEGSSERA